MSTATNYGGTSVETLQTPALLLNVERVQRNVTRLQSHLLNLGVPLRPHLKTAKCVEVARMEPPHQPLVAPYSLRGSARRLGRTRLPASLRRFTLMLLIERVLRFYFGSISKAQL